MKKFELNEKQLKEITQKAFIAGYDLCTHHEYASSDFNKPEEFKEWFENQIKNL